MGRSSELLSVPQEAFQWKTKEAEDLGKTEEACNEREMKAEIPPKGEQNQSKSPSRSHMSKRPSLAFSSRHHPRSEENSSA